MNNEWTQRDELAKVAMIALIAKSDFTVAIGFENNQAKKYRAIANGAYMYAEAMLRARESTLIPDVIG